MNRRKFLAGTAAFGAMAGWPAHSRAEQENMSNAKGVVVSTSKLIAPAKGTIPVAVAVSEGATVIDFAGPWDVFVGVMMPERGPGMTDQMPVYGVGQTGSGNGRGRDEGGAALHL
jgi:hypothetical protein